MVLKWQQKERAGGIFYLQVIIIIIIILRVNPLTNTAQVLIQNLARRQGICFITKYTGLDFHLLTPTEII